MNTLPPLWALWRNPIVLRCWRSRMRLRAFLPWALVTLAGCGFVYLIITNALTARFGSSESQAANALILPFFIIQSVILLLGGTGSVAGGLVEEEAEGMIDYQRLTPLPPAWKIAGYLFGMPVREYCLVALTMPFMLLALASSDVPWTAAVQVYLVFFSSALLYHMTGYVAGFTIRSRRLASRLVQVMVIALYLLLPQLSAFGYVIFEHLTVRPVLFEQFGSAIMDGLNAQSPRREWSDIGFYGLSISPTVFSLAIQLSLFAVMAGMVRRKWQDAGRHALGKVTALGLHGGLAFLALGNLLPLLASDRLFPSQAMARSGGRLGLLARGMGSDVGAGEAGVLVALFAMLLLLAGSLALVQCAPTRDEYLRGWRRAGRLSRRRVPWRADEASCWPWAIAVSVLSALAVHLFGTALAGYPPIGGGGFAISRVLPLAVIMALPLLSLVAAVEVWEKRGLFLMIFLVWAVPSLTSLVMGATSDEGAAVGTYIAAISPLTLPFLAMLPESADWGVTTVHGPRAFVAGSVFHFGLAAWTLWRLARAARELRDQAKKSILELNNPASNPVKADGEPI